jgi:hypothetical protein
MVNVGIAGGDGIVGFRVESIDYRVEMGWLMVNCKW